MNTTIYVYLLDEGVEVWRPVSAERVGDDVYRITDAQSNDDTETWEFKTGETVRCKERDLSGGRHLVAYERVTNHAA